MRLKYLILTSILLFNPLWTARKPELYNSTYLGNDSRSYYGNGIPRGLRPVGKFYLGAGKTRIGKIRLTWKGAGWTGQPAVVKDGKKTYLVIGAYDHHLRKIEIEELKEVWKFKFRDVIKGSPTVFIDELTDKEENRLVILQGSRKGLSNFHSPSNAVPSFRAVSFRTGKELWALDISKTGSYSRDNDSSAIHLGSNIIFNAAENGIGYFLDASPAKARKTNGLKQPLLLGQVRMYMYKDQVAHRGNLVSEASPSRLRERLYMASGSGHIYGIDIPSMRIGWDFFTGSDMDGSVVIDSSGCLYAAVEKQYIPGPGGLFKFDPAWPAKDPAAVRWWLPVPFKKTGEWLGGIIGSAAINDNYNEKYPPLFACISVDGHLYIGSQTEKTGSSNLGPRLKYYYPEPRVYFQRKLFRASISTPIFTEGHRLVAAGDDFIYLLQLVFTREKKKTPYNAVGLDGKFYRVSVRLRDIYSSANPGGRFQSTPVVHKGIVYICCRDGYLYALGGEREQGAGSREQ